MRSHVRSFRAASYFILAWLIWNHICFDDYSLSCIPPNTHNHQIESLFHFCYCPCFSSARKRTTSCTIPESVRGSWKEHFAGTEAKIQLKVDIGATSAKLHIDVENTKSEAEFDCLAEGDGYFLTKENVPSDIKKWSDIRSAVKGKNLERGRGRIALFLF